MYVRVLRVLSACAPAFQMRALDSIIDDCEPPCGCSELNSGPLEEQSVRHLSSPLQCIPKGNKFLNPKATACLVHFCQ